MNAKKVIAILLDSEKPPIAYDDAFMADLFTAAADPVGGMMAAIKQRREFKRKIPAKKSESYDLELDAKPVGDAHGWHGTTMIGIRWSKNSSWYSHRWAMPYGYNGGGYFFIRKEKWDLFEESLRELVKVAAQGEFDATYIQHAYSQVLTCAYVARANRGKRITQGMHAYFR